MRRIKISGLCLVIIFTMSAVMAASASAVLPEFSSPFAKTFTSTSKASLLETTAKVKLVCTADTNAGEITGSQTGSVTIAFTGCALKKVPCNTPGRPSGTIVTSLLSLSLGYINKAKKEVGIDLASAAGGVFAEFGCGSALRGVVLGSVIGRITPVNKKVIPAAFFTLRFTQAIGIQKIINLEGGPPDVLETSFGGPSLQSGLSSTDRIFFSEPVLISA
ncbi:MAG: hypothetical protein ACHQAV_00010 [Solirubrobacterales bacterium]